MMIKMRFLLIVIVFSSAGYFNVSGFWLRPFRFNWSGYLNFNSRRINQQNDGHQSKNQNGVREDTSLREVDIALTNNSGWLALHLDQQLSQERPGQNIIISPSCLQMALALVLLASRGETSLQIAQILGSYDGKVRGTDIVRNSDTVHKIFKRIFEATDTRRDISSNLQTQHSSGIFIQEGHRLQRQYLTYSRYLYKSDVISTNFKKEASKTQNLINSWVKNKTRGKIPTLLSTSPVPSTELMICSTLYFKGDWEEHFRESENREKFTTETGRTIDVTMLFTRRRYPYFVTNDGVKMIGLPYEGREAWMYVILPESNGIAGLQTLKRSLTPKIVNEMIKNMKIKSVSVKIPKMNLTTNVKLNKAFYNLGVKNLFNPTADLSGLLDPDSDLPGLYVSDFVHAVEIAIDQRGTEAGAATAIFPVFLMWEETQTFHVDRPFIFFIRNEETKSILFWGSIVTPQ